jgi:hypothetical protein
LTFFGPDPLALISIPTIAIMTFFGRMKYLAMVLIFIIRSRNGILPLPLLCQHKYAKD